MSYGDDGALSTSTSSKLLKLSREISVLGASRSPCGLTRHTTQPGTAFTDLAADPFACALVVSGTHACPASKMGCSWELTNICSHFCDETPSRHTIHPGNRNPTIQCLRQVQVLLPKLIQSSVQQLDFSFDKVQLAKQALQKKAMMVTYLAF